ncbi:alpha/beta hydrolase [Streptomyces spectabilis]|uniref:Alpha/beta hydrolase n=1 Tax=Streptomyces spectabilis TaxID=68270 RepID=A0A516RF07_STRST|nr:alpha/beta hydrolase [Streptomyces spectabilis]QDQ14234.1 alpha/beta hydrolase [Streptomyces spectabilis]
MTRTTRTAPLLAAGIAAAFLSTLTPATGFPASEAVAARDPLRPYTQQKPHWQRCDAESPASFQCATLEVPLDYGDPGGKRTDIAISRLKAASTAERRGVLLLNPGGPGGPGLRLPVDPAVRISEDVRRRYDLIGFDPRGVGRSSPVGCGLTRGEQEMEHPYRARTFAKDVRWARTVAAKCRAANGATLRHLTTRNTARDMDVVRAVLGERKISYLGFSYGTYLGAVYTQMFPRRVDRFVLDSAADPTRYGRGMFQTMAEGTEPAFARWSRWTARRHAAYGLGTTSAEVRRTFWDLVARADREPIVLDGHRLTGDDIRAQRATFFHARKAAAWVAGLKEAAGDGKRGGGERRDPGPAPAPSARDVPPDNETAGAWAVLCADTRASWPRDPERYRRDAINDKRRYPLYGDFASGIKPCAFWKRGSEPATTVNNDVRALILQNAWDPQTPLSGAQAMHRALRGSRMVTVAGGEGHIVNGTNSCADDSATAYLTTGRLPADDLTCRASASARRHGSPAPR